MAWGAAGACRRCSRASLAGLQADTLSCSHSARSLTGAVGSTALRSPAHVPPHPPCPRAAWLKGSELARPQVAHPGGSGTPASPGCTALCPLIGPSAKRPMPHCSQPHIPHSPLRRPGARRVGRQGRRTAALHRRLLHVADQEGTPGRIDRVSGPAAHKVPPLLLGAIAGRRPSLVVGPGLAQMVMGSRRKMDLPPRPT